MEVFYNAGPLDNGREQVKGWFYSVMNDTFVNINPTRIKGIEEKKYFVKKGRGFKRARKRVWFPDYVFEHFDRDPRTLRRRSFDSAVTFKDETILVLVQPHEFVHKKERPVKTKVVYDPLNNKFYFMTNDDYKNEALNKHTRGHLLVKAKGQWRKLRKNGAYIKYSITVGEIEAQNIQNDVADNLLLWLSKLKYNKYCTRCKNECKQAKLIGEMHSCKNYEKS